MPTWKPIANINTLKARANCIRDIREFFYARDVMEVETPHMAQFGVTDVYLDNIKAQLNCHSKKNAFLQTSPEFFMKRLLCAGSGSIYQISKAFRDEASTQLHNPEFTMLEWYREGYTHVELMDEVEVLLQKVLHCAKAYRMSYQELFLTFLNVCPFNASLRDFEVVAKAHGIHLMSQIDCRDEWLFLLLSHLIEPKLGFEAPVIIYDFPVSQASLARLNAKGDRAHRFEVYVNGVELANGFWELDSAKEQVARFQQDNDARRKLHKTPMAIDDDFISALEHGLPDCAGVALGIDRLVMLALGKKNIQEVMAFPY